MKVFTQSLSKCISTINGISKKVTATDKDNFKFKSNNKVLFGLTNTANDQWKYGNTINDLKVECSQQFKTTITDRFGKSYIDADITFTNDNKIENLVGELLKSNVGGLCIDYDYKTNLPAICYTLFDDNSKISRLDNRSELQSIMLTILKKCGFNTEQSKKIFTYLMQDLHYTNSNNFSRFADTQYMLESTNTQLQHEVDLQRDARIAERQYAAAVVIEWALQSDMTLDSDELQELAGLFLDSSEIDFDALEFEEQSIDIYNYMTDFMRKIGVDSGIIGLLAERDIDAATTAQRIIKSKITNDDDAAMLIQKFALNESMMLEATKKIVQHGVVKTVQIRKRKAKPSIKLLQTLAKARERAWTATARASRIMSMRVRKKAGL